MKLGDRLGVGKAITLFSLAPNNFSGLSLLRGIGMGRSQTQRFASTVCESDCYLALVSQSISPIHL
jgi:hypothetical protein